MKQDYLYLQTGADPEGGLWGLKTPLQVEPQTGNLRQKVHGGKQQIVKDRYTLIEQSRTIMINYDIASCDDSSRDMDCLKFSKWQKTHAYCA